MDKNNIKIIFETGDGGFEEITQYHNKSWVCAVNDNDKDKEIPLTLVTRSIDMDEATGEDEYKDYPVIVEFGILNKNCHKSISLYTERDYSGKYSNVQDVMSYCGFVSITTNILSTDILNKNFQNELKIKDACMKSYKCRFSGETKQYPAFKTHEAANEFAEKLVYEYGNTLMALVGFALDRPVNLVGETGWRTIELCHHGIEKQRKREV